MFWCSIYEICCISLVYRRSIRFLLFDRCDFYFFFCFRAWKIGILSANLLIFNPNRPMVRYLLTGVIVWRMPCVGPQLFGQLCFACWFELVCPSILGFAIYVFFADVVARVSRLFMLMTPLLLYRYFWKTGFYLIMLWLIGHFDYLDWEWYQVWGFIWKEFDLSGTSQIFDFK